MRAFLAAAVLLGVASAPAAATTMTGAVARSRTSAESSGRRAPESNTTRAGCRTGPATSRAVSGGSAARAGPRPTPTQSLSARPRCTRPREAAPPLHLPRPHTAST